MTSLIEQLRHRLEGMIQYAKKRESDMAADSASFASLGVASGRIAALREVRDMLTAAPHYGDWRDEIPWDALRPEIEWVAMDEDEDWYGYETEPRRALRVWGGQVYQEHPLHAIRMPTPPNWRESKVRRPNNG